MDQTKQKLQVCPPNEPLQPPQPKPNILPASAGDFRIHRRLHDGLHPGFVFKISGSASDKTEPLITRKRESNL